MNKILAFTLVPVVALLVLGASTGVVISPWTSTSNSTNALAALNAYSPLTNLNGAMFGGTNGATNLILTGFTTPVTWSANAASTFTHDTSWTTAAGGSFQHTPGSTTTLALNQTFIGSFQPGQYSVVVSNMTAGFITNVFATGSGSYVTNIQSSAGTVVTYIGLGAVASTFTLYPSSAFDGYVNVAFFYMSNSAPAMQIQDAGTANQYFQIRGSASNFNVYVGGYSGGFDNSSSVRNLAVGYDALCRNVSGQRNTALGDLCCAYSTSGSFNMALGTSAMNYSTIGSYNVAAGFDALDGVGDNFYCVAIGCYSGQSTIGNFETYVGALCGRYNTYGSNNTAVGYYSIGYSTADVGCVALGYGAGNYTGNATSSPGISSVDTYCGFIGFESGRDPVLTTATVLSNAWAFGYLATVRSNNTVNFGSMSYPLAINATGGMASDKQTNKAPVNIWTNTAATTTYWTNTTGLNGFALIDAGTVTAIGVNGTTVFTSSGRTIPLNPMGYVSITYSVAPTMNWVWQ